MTDETQGLGPPEDAPVLPVDSSPTPPQEPAAPADETQKADDSRPEQPRDEDGKFLSEKAQKRIDHLTWEREQARREAEFYRAQALQQPKPQPEPPAAKLPTLEEHGYDEAKYQAALIQYATQQAERVVEERLSKAEQQRAEQARVESFATRQREFMKATPDFEAKVLRDPTLPITEAMRDVIVDSESGPELAYYLANNRETASAIAHLPPHLAARELGRIEARLEAQKEAAKRPPVSKAPPPPPTVDSTEADVAKNPLDESMSMREWMSWRDRQARKKR